MAIITTEDMINNAIKKISDDLLMKVEKLQEKTQMEDEYFATVIGNTIIASIDAGIRVVDTIKKHELVDAQIKTEVAREADLKASTVIKYQQELAERIKNGDVSITHTYDDDTGEILTTTYGTGTSKSIYEVQKDAEEQKISESESNVTNRSNLANRDIAIKAQQELAEKIKNGDVSITHTYDDDTGEILTTTYGTGTSKSIYEVQKNKYTADIAFVTAQKAELEHSVVYNNRLKTLESYKGYLGDLGLGGFVIPKDMTKLYLDMVSNIYTNGNTTPQNITLTLPTATDTVLAT